MNPHEEYINRLSAEEGPAIAGVIASYTAHMRAAGVVRVDTRNPDPAMVERVAREIVSQVGDRPRGRLGPYDAARAVLAALAAPEDTP